MIDRLFETIAPHYCYECTKIGSLLCGNCKYDITYERFARCILCGISTDSSGVCKDHDAPYSRAWYAGNRTGVLQQLVDGLKFQCIRAASASLAEILADTLSQLPPATILVPIPTATAHIRERGFDHTLLLTQQLAKRRGLSWKPLLQRVTSTKQRGAGREMRIAQAKSAFKVRGLLDDTLPYLLIDDVVTTGATLHYAAMALREGGAKEVWAAAVCRQPLD